MMQKRSAFFFVLVLYKIYTSYGNKSATQDFPMLCRKLFMLNVASCLYQEIRRNKNTYSFVAFGFTHVFHGKEERTEHLLDAFK